MAFDWREFLLSAHELRNAAQESKRRTAIGRAYYYAYNVALIEATKLAYNPSFPPKALGVHKRLWSWCQRQPNSDIVALGVSGNTLHARRLQVDYNAAKPVSSLAVQRQLAEVRDFEILLAKITNSLPPPPLP